jgi:hypothetical protein
VENVLTLPLKEGSSLTKVRVRLTCPACGRQVYVVFDNQQSVDGLATLSCPRKPCTGSIRAEVPATHVVEPAD